MALKFPDKDPAANKDYGLDWSAMLTTGETIVAATWTADSVDLLVGTAAVTGSVSAVWLSGGVDGVTYKVTNRITTSRGLIDERTVSIKVKGQ